MPSRINKTDVGGGKKKVVHRIVTMTASETKVTLATNAQYMAIENIGTGIVYIGGTGVTTTEYGFFITPKEVHNFGFVNSGFNFYGIMVAAGTSTLGIIEDA